jgi:predicted nucleic-acid-binding protein
MRKLIDANVILRYLLKDPPKMAEAAKTMVEEGAFTLPEVVAEVVYVLKGVYSIERVEIGAVLTEFLNEVSIEPHAVICEALRLFAATSLDFVDCLLVARHRILGDEIGSFDAKLNQMLR